MSSPAVSRLSRASIVACIVVVVALSLAGNSFFTLIEKHLSDVYGRFMGEPDPDDRVVIIEIDDKTLEYYFPEIPLPRGQIAILLDQLADPMVDAKTIAFDLYFEGPDKVDPAWDTLLSMITAAHKDRMVGAIYFSDVSSQTEDMKVSKEIFQNLRKFSYPVESIQIPTASSNNLPLSLLMDNADYYGHINVYQDETGVFRELPLFIECGDQVVGALALEALVNYLDIERSDVRVVDGELRLGNFTIPIDKNSIMRFQHFGPRESYTRYSLIDLLDDFESGSVPMGTFHDKIVLVGINSKTYYPNEYSYSSFGYERPNVFIHADVINSIFSNRYLKEVPRSVLPTMSILLGMMFVSIHVLRNRKLRLLLSIGSMVVLLSLDFFLFSRGLLLQLIPLLIISLPMTVYTYFVSYSEQADIIVAQEKETLQLRRKEESLVALEKEIKVGRAIQERLLPQTFPSIAGFDIHAINLPAKGVSGDFYDFLQIDADHWAMMVADVSGKGISAALLMAASQTVLRSESLKLRESPDDCSSAVQAANDLIFAITGPSHFLTLFYLILDSKGSKITYANAGNNPPIYLCQDGSTKMLETGDLILGALPGSRYEPHSLKLAPGEKLVIFTDGPGDAVNESGEFYGEQKLREIVEMHRNLSAEAITDKITEDIVRFAGSADQADDITIVVVGRDA